MPNYYIAITIDTEIDKSPSWAISSRETYYSVTEGIPHKLTPLFNHYGARPTYLLSPEVIENKDCIVSLEKTRNCELGTHLHGDLIDPSRTIHKFGGAETKEFQSSYTRDVEFEKLDNLTRLFKMNFGYQPTSFRAGRFGAGNNTVTLLEELGYLVDSSVTPGIDWDYPEGRANFLTAREQPYFPSKNNIMVSGDSKILEVPVSIVRPNLIGYTKISNNSKIPSLAKSIVNKIFPLTWLRPSNQTSKELLCVIKKLTERNHNIDNVVYNMMFHSMEIIPNASPYTKTKEECELFLQKIGTVLNFCILNNIKCITLSELYPIFANNEKSKG